MDDQTRRDVDEACLRLLGFDPQWDADYGDWAVMIGGSRRHRCPSRDPSFIVPLAEALRARGWDPYLISYIGGGWMWRAIQHVPILRAVTAEADTIQEALAIVTARAVGTETKE